MRHDSGRLSRQGNPDRARVRRVSSRGMSLASVAERLSSPEAFLSRTDLRQLGLERRAVDSVFRALPVVVFPGYSRPIIKVKDYLALIERSTYREDRVRPTRGSGR